MTGTFAKMAQQVVSSEGKSVSMRIAAGILAVGLLAVATPASPRTRAAMATGAERRIEVSRTLDRVKIENLQRWVSAGHDEWCKDARLVAVDEMKRLAPALDGASPDLDALPPDAEPDDEAGRAVFVWSSLDGRATYRVTVERFGWLLPIAGDADSIVWVPTHAEVIAHR